MTDKNTAFRPLGVSGLTHWGRRISEEYLTELRGDRWHRVIREMTTNDPMIGGILFAIEMLMRQVGWAVAPFSIDDADIERASFVNMLSARYAGGGSPTLAEMPRSCRGAGRPLEITYKLPGRRKTDAPLQQSLR